MPSDKKMDAVLREASAMIREECDEGLEGLSNACDGLIKDMEEHEKSGKEGKIYYAEGYEEREER